MGNKYKTFNTTGTLEQHEKEGDEYQKHRCGFFPKDFEEMGYDIMIRVDNNGEEVQSFLAVKKLY